MSTNPAVLRKSKYVGVYPTDSGKWRAEIHMGGGERRFLGRFDSEEDAAAAYSAALALRDPREKAELDLDTETETRAADHDSRQEDREATRAAELQQRVVSGTATPEIEAHVREAANSEERKSRAELYDTDLGLRVNHFEDDSERQARETERADASNSARESREALRDQQREERWKQRQLSHEAVRAAIAEEREHRRAAYEIERAARHKAALEARELERKARKPEKALELKVTLPSDFSYTPEWAGWREWDCPACETSQTIGQIFTDSVRCKKCGDVSEIKSLMARNFMGWRAAEEAEDQTETKPAEKRAASRESSSARIVIGHSHCKWCGKRANDQRAYMLGDGVAHVICPAPTKQELARAAQAEEEAEAAAEQEAIREGEKQASRARVAILKWVLLAIPLLAAWARDWHVGLLLTILAAAICGLRIWRRGRSAPGRVTVTVPDRK